MRLRWSIFALSFSLLLSINLLPAQNNLLADGSFEKSGSSNCINPDKGFFSSPFWYVLDATPDLFVGGCSFEETENYFWKTSVSATDGKNFAGLSGRWNSNSTYVSEGIATKLSEPLTAGTTYFFTMCVKNEGGYQGLADLTFCVLRPQKHIDLYTSPDSIFLTNNFGNGTAASSGKLVASIDADPVQSSLPGDWTKVTTCFKALGGEQYFAIQMPLGTFGELPACAGNASSGVFRTFYYFVDDLNLSSLPNIAAENISFCKNEQLEIDLDQTFGENLPGSVTYLWDDGFIGSTRRFLMPGTIGIAAILDCGEISLQLQITEESCTPDFFVPTGFSPNDDGHNDVFQFFLPSSVEVNKFEMAIYNRWGSKIFGSHNPDDGWDGKLQSLVLPTDTYIWSVNLEWRSAQGLKNYSGQGSVMLIR
jgi:gliding motility-associated-like protein